MCSMIFLNETKVNFLSTLRQRCNAQNIKHLSSHFCLTSYAVDQTDKLQDLCNTVSTPIGGLDDLESSLDRFEDCLQSSVVTQVIDRCKEEAPGRRLLRFFSWARKKLNVDLEDKDYNHAIRVFAEKKDHPALVILMSDLTKDCRVLDKHTFGLVAEALVKLGREDEALGIFKNLDKFNCPQDSKMVVSIINALCSKGHAKKAEGVLLHHKSRLEEGAIPCVYKCLLYGWCVKENPKEARRIIKEMRLDGVTPDIFCFNTFLKCLCEKNLKKNPSGLVPESLNVMMEMRSYKIIPNSISYNVLLSCLGRARRVRESCQVLDSMINSGCIPDWFSYYLVIRVLYLSGRFGKGNELVDKMIAEGMVPEHNFYYNLVGILCGVERVNHALQLFKRMKRSSIGGYGPVYNILIPKLCRGGSFSEARELWDEAESMGITLNCSRDLLDNKVTQVFKPTRKAEVVNLSAGIVEEPWRQKSPVCSAKKRNAKVKKTTKGLR